MILCMVGCSGRRFRHTFFHQIVGFNEVIVSYQELFCVIYNDTGELDQPRRRRRKREMTKQKQKDRTAYGSLRCQTLEKLFGTAMRLLLVPLITNMTIKLRNREIQKVDETKFLGIINYRKTL